MYNTPNLNKFLEKHGLTEIPNLIELPGFAIFRFDTLDPETTAHLLEIVLEGSYEQIISRRLNLPADKKRMIRQIRKGIRLIRIPQEGGDSKC